VFVWRYLDARGTETGTSEAFEDESSAEAWLSGGWEELLERGVEAVELVEAEAGSGEVRYRMELRPEDPT
jgi:hypothetical protein